MPPDDLLVIATFIKSIDAELARGALEAAGIESLIRADDCGGTRPHLWMGGIELLVRDEDADRAREILGTEATLMDTTTQGGGQPE
jgi:Putative prokaryotic signal transducing protein